MNNTKLYNLLLPLWLLIFVPSWLWLLLIPANYIIDRIILKWSLREKEDKGLFCRKHTWKICLAGFLSDFTGAILLLAAAVLMSSAGGDSFIGDTAGGVMMNPFTNVLSFLVTAAGIALAAMCIYLLDKRILSKAGLTAEQAKKVCGQTSCNNCAISVSDPIRNTVSRGALTTKWPDRPVISFQYSQTAACSVVLLIQLMIRRN